MSAFTSIFNPRAGRFGILPHSSGVQIGTGGRALTAAATVSINVSKGFNKIQVISVCIVAQTAAAGSGAITAQLFKVVNGVTRTAITGAFDLTTGGITTVDKTIVIPITGTNATTTLQAADSLTVDLVAVGTVTTAPQACLSVTKASLS